MPMSCVRVPSAGPSHKLVAVPASLHPEPKEQTGSWNVPLSTHCGRNPFC